MKGGSAPPNARICVPQGICDFRYTFGLKTAISIPDDLVASAEKLSRRTKRSRSDIYSAAVREYVARHSGDAVTEAMNETLDKVGSARIDPFVSQAARMTLEQVEW